LASIPISFVVEPRREPRAVEAGKPDAPTVDLNAQAALALIGFLALSGALWAGRVLAAVGFGPQRHAFLSAKVR
jgi:hypothetical protein